MESLTCDHDGYLWAATRNGLARYDGYKVDVYRHDADKPHSLWHNFISKVMVDSSNRLWIISNMGVGRYRRSTDDFEFFPTEGGISSIAETGDGKIVCGGTRFFVFDEAESAFKEVARDETDHILAIITAPDGRVFMSTNKSILFYDASLTKITHLSPEVYASYIKGFDGIVPLMFDHLGRLWIGRNGDGVMNIDLMTGQTNIFAPAQLSDGTVRVICEDRNHNVWLGTEKGITIIRPMGNIEIIRQNFTAPVGLNDNAIYDIVCDASNNIWIGTYFGGINAYMHAQSSFSVYQPGADGHALTGKAVRQMIEPEKGRLWIATEDGGINILELSTKQFIPFDKIPELGSNVHALFADKANNQIWIGTFRNGLFRYNPSTNKYIRYLPDGRSGLNSDAVFDIVKQHNGRLWVGTTLGLYVYDEVSDRFTLTDIPTLDTEFIYCLMVDRNDNLWIGTRNRGLFKMDGQSGDITNWDASVANCELKDNYITALFEDVGGNIWIGTNNNGVYSVDPETMKVTKLTGDLSLASGCICGFEEDTEGFLWISTSQGLYKYYPKNRFITRFTSDSGLISNQFNFHSSFKGSDGRIYMGTVFGLVSFIPHLASTLQKKYEVHFKNLYINDVAVSPAKEGSPLTEALNQTAKLTLSHKDSHSFAIDYGIVSLSNAEAVRYQVKFDGVDADWRNVGTDRRFVSLNIAPGTYTLNVRANNSNDGWEFAPVKSLTITVEPPLYKSWYAYLFYFACLLSLAYIAYRLCIIKIKAREAVRFANMEKEKAINLNNAKLEFFTIISHELKTPLSLIIAPLKQLSASLKSERERKHLDVAVRNAGKMVGIIDQLVTFNKVESGNFQFYLEKGNPIAFVEDVAHLFTDQAEVKTIHYCVECEDNGEEVWFSPLYVERIVSNLLSNAFKFTMVEGTITVKAAIQAEADGQTWLCIEVADSGIGIAKEEIDHIFNNFYQTRRGFNANKSGWGLGLTLARRLAEIHKGDIKVDSVVGQGSKFSVRLNVSNDAFDASCRIDADKMIVPVSEYHYTTPLRDADSLAPQANHEAAKLHLLIVEDEKELREFLSDMFSADFNVTVAADGMEALRVLEDTAIGLIISDVMMPNMDGITLTQRVKSNVKTSHIPVILLTAKSGSDDMIEGYQSGAEAFVSKPFDPKALMLQVNNIMRLSSVRLEEIVNAEPSEKLTDDTLTEGDRDFINRANELIEKHIGDDDFSVHDMTLALGVNRTLLYSKMKSILGITLGDFIRKKRMSHAKKLLLLGNTITETAYATGFSDPSYFAKVFKKEEGISPSEYQMNNKRRL